MFLIPTPEIQTSQRLFCALFPLPPRRRGTQFWRTIFLYFGPCWLPTPSCQALLRTSESVNFDCGCSWAVPSQKAARGFPSSLAHAHHHHRKKIFWKTLLASGRTFQTVGRYNFQFLPLWFLFPSTKQSASKEQVIV